MKKLVFIALLAISFYAQAQTAEVKEYYKNIDFNTTGITLQTALGKLITETHTRKLSYTPGVWEALKVADLDPENKDQVILIYGHPGKTTGIQSRVRAKNSNGGSNGQWNREHVFAKSLGNPNLGESGPGSDAHHLRPSDVQWNSSRGNLKFANGSGKSGSVSGGWYPGDEWKGDVARMMMYMYLRYGDQCLPTRVGEGSSTGTIGAMIDLFLNWNAEDPVSELEIQRNNYLGNTSNTYAQGNRNPFIDNPYLATKIWGGKVAQDTWGTLSTGKEEFVFALKIYPNPTIDSFVLQSKDLIEKVEIYSLTGQLVNTYNNINSNTYSVTGLAKGVYLITAYTKNGKETRKVVVQ